jgi:hypothetical protein
LQRIWTFDAVVVDQSITSLPKYKTASYWQIPFASLGLNQKLLAMVEYRKFRIET